MNNIFKLSMFFVAIFSFVACNDDDSSIEENSVGNYVRFLESGELSVSEASGEMVELPVYLNYRSGSDVTITYTIEGDLGSFEDQTENPGELTIPAGSRSGKISIMPIDNTDYNEVNNKAVVTIVGVSGDYVVTDNVDYLSKEITFLDNDCPPNDRDQFVGPLMIEDVGYGTMDGVGELSFDNCSVINITGDLPNAGARTPTYEFVLSEDNKTVICLPQPYEDLPYNYEASGTYENGVITVDYVFYKPDGSVYWTGTNIIKK